MSDDFLFVLLTCGMHCITINTHEHDDDDEILCCKVAYITLQWVRVKTADTMHSH